MSYLKQLLLWSLIFYSSVAWAKGDRMAVAVPQQQKPNIEQAVQQAWPILLDRLLPRATRAQGDGLLAGTDVVSKLSNQKKHTVVFFDEKTVAKVLKVKGLHWFRHEPPLKLTIDMTNLQGKPMLKSRLFMSSMAQELANHWGIGLVENGKVLSLHWFWQHNGLVELRVQSQNASYGETRQINLQDSVPAMRLWLQEVMLKARDQQLIPSEVAGDKVVGKVVEGEKRLTLKREMRLEEVVAFENLLRLEPSVRVLLASRYSKKEQVYRLDISSKDDAWLVRWFQARGMTLSHTDEGWTVR